MPKVFPPTCSRNSSRLSFPSAFFDATHRACRSIRIFARAATAVIALASRWELSRRLGKFKFVNKRLNLTIA